MFQVYFCENLLILISKTFGFKFFAATGEVGEINTNLLNIESFYVEKGSLVLKGNLDFCLKFKKNAELPKTDKKPKNFYSDEESFYYEFKHLSNIKISFSKTSLCLNKEGTEALNMLMITTNQKPLITSNNKQRYVVIGFEIKTKEDFKRFLNVSTIAAMLNKFGFNYLVTPIILSQNLKYKADNYNINIKYNYLIDKTNNLKTEYIDKQNYFCINLFHHIFKLSLSGGNLNVCGGGIQCKIYNLDQKIKDFKYIENTIILKKGNYYVKLDDNISFNITNLKNVYKTIFNWQNDFFYLFKRVTDGKLKVSDEILNKMLASLKKHIKERKNLKEISKKLFCLCGYIFDGNKKTGLLRLATLIGKLTEKEDLWNFDKNQPSKLPL